MINWPFLFFYIFLFSVAWWLYFGYLIFIFLRSTQESDFMLVPTSSQPTIAILVPCYNEEHIVENKIRNTFALNYPKKKMQVIFIDGGSTDKTVAIIEEHMKEHTSLKVIKARERGKIQQINEVLPFLTEDIIICTDVDGELDPHTLHIISALLQDKKIGLVGIKIDPKSILPEEVYFWDQQNRLRLAESKYYSPLYVIAVCYGFRNDFIKKFPEDVIADDIYLSFLAIKKGLKTMYTNKATARELRSPSIFSQLWHHKVRKTHAFLNELFRFFPSFVIAPIRWQIIFYTRAAQILVGPLFLFALLAFFVYMTFTSLTGLLPFLTFFFLAFTYLIIRPIALKGFFNKLKTFIFIHLVIFYCLLTHFFYHQTSNYKKTK